MSSVMPWLEALIVAATAGLALLFQPFAVLKAPALRTPWLAALVVLPLLWSLQRGIPGVLPLQLSGACMLVLVLGWPLAVWTLVGAGAIGAALGAGSVADWWPRALELATWQGVVPATLALLLGLLTRRWLPPHPFVFILGRGFIGTALAVMAAGAIFTLVRDTPTGTTAATVLIGRWLMAWGEASLTGMLVAVFVAFRPEWLLTWSDARYLPRS